MKNNNLKRFFKIYVKNNLGVINLIGKTSGRILFLLLTSFFAYKLSVEDFADFAIFWSALRLLTFFSANNLYIIYFNKVRNSLIEDKRWPILVSSNMFFTSVLFSIISTVISFFIFDSLFITLSIFPTLLLFIIVRNLSEFSKSDNSLFLSIFIEDFLFYILFFIFGISSLFIFNSLEMIIIALFLSILITAVVCLVLFKNKFQIKITKYKLKLKDFSFDFFKLGLNYTFLRGNEFFSNFGVRYLGQIYFGDLFVSYAHIMYQFYNIFALITMSVISGLQSKITVKDTFMFNKVFIREMYFNILKTIAPFVLVTILVIAVFNFQILQLFFPKYIQYNYLLIKVSFTGLIFMIIQPLVFILIYNNKVFNIKTLNITQYGVMLMVYFLPVFFTNFIEQYWLLLCMTSFIIVQGFYAVLNYKTIK